MVIVSYIYGPAHPDVGIKGIYTAPATNIEDGITLTKAELIEDAISNGVDGDTDPADLFTITKATVV